MPECVRCGSYTTLGHPHYCEPEPLRELPYTPDTGYPEPEREQPTGPYGPHLYELLPWRKDGDDWIVEYRGLVLRCRADGYEDRYGNWHSGWKVLQFWHSERSAWREAVEDADWLLFSRPRLRGLPFEIRGVRTRELMREFKAARN